MDTEHRDVEGTYDLASASYDEAHAARTSTEITAVEEIVVLSLLRNINFDDVLDAGTGTGRYAIRLAQTGKHVAGIDVSEQMLDQARAKAGRLGLDISFQRASVLAVPQPDESFDLVICALALAHVKDLAAAVRELVRVLRPGGHLIVSDLHPDIQKVWGPNFTTTIQGQEVPFPNYHGDITEYLHSVRAAGAEVLATIDIPMQQQRGLFPGPMVILARKGQHKPVEPAVSADARHSPRLSSVAR